MSAGSFNGNCRCRLMGLEADSTVKRLASFLFAIYASAKRLEILSRWKRAKEFRKTTADSSRKATTESIIPYASYNFYIRREAAKSISFPL
jgi:hypothetical protein